MGVRNTKPTIGTTETGRKKKVSEPTQHTPMQRVMVLKDGRRKVMEWRKWNS
ncbi:hypothetical protein ACFWPU_00800 [Streptomyces sp. NPDC058471]|uniref:hypothetical protein n=1 Tax=Streptomyces sp. NPDC058471 TaxID=3346516 RepID=UPI0036474EE9